MQKLCKAGFLPANHTRVNGFRFCRYAIFVGGVRRPIRVPLLRFRSLGHDRQGPQAVVGSSGAFIRLIQLHSIDAKQEDFRVPRLNYLHKIKATEGFAPPYPVVPWTSPLTDSNRLSGLCKRTAPPGGLHFSSAMLLNGLEPIARIGLAYPVYETGVLPLN